MSKWVDYRATVLLLFGAAVIRLMAPGGVRALEISDSPMEIMVQTPPPIMMMLLDNSASMDCELMTSESFGLFGDAYYIFPDSTYLPQNDHVHGDGHALDADQQRAWKTQWAEYNRVYYSPGKNYSPWPSAAQHAFGPADLHRPLSDPAGADGRQVRLNLAALFFSVTGARGQVPVYNAHYFARSATGDGAIYLVTWEDADGDGKLDLGGTPENDRRKYYRFTDDGDGQVTGDELAPVTREAEKNAVRPAIRDDLGSFIRYATDREELQNFANWFSYHRRRILAAKAAVAALIHRSRNRYIGLYALNGTPRMAVQPVGMHADRPEAATADAAPVDVLLDAIYGMACGGRTPLRQALDQVGRYCRRDLTSELGPSPWAAGDDGGGCQRASAVVISDGFWNGPTPSVGNADGNNGRPFADGWSDTLADVAMRHYEQDLAPGLPDDLPPLACDDAPHQHLTTTTLSFGVPVTAGASTLAGGQPADSCRAIEDRLTLNWPSPTDGRPPELPGRASEAGPVAGPCLSGPAADDLWHAAINGRGSYLDMQDTAGFDSTLADPLAAADAFASASGVAVNSGVISDRSVVYQAWYHADDWRGEVTATALGGSPVLWRASEWLKPDESLWDTRRVVTFGGGWRHPEGVPFRYDDLSGHQMAALGSDLNPGSLADRQARDTVAFIRGRETDGMRTRDSLLGDVVHATPVLFGQTLFVGANDGMLHAFDARSGRERFAYVPNLLLADLKALASPNYAGRHRFFVDGPVHAGEVLVDRYERKTYLVGGLGKGGRGYFCLLVGHRLRPRQKGGFGDYQWNFHVDQLDASESERDLAPYIRWEYPGPHIDDDGMDNDGDGSVDEAGETDPDMGFSFGQAFAVNGNAPADAFRPVVIMANGYDSPAQSAVLYVLSADTGRLIRKIDTGVAGENGLSTPALVDVDLDRRVDYAYAGDLRGNLWKFDLSAASPDRWGVAYGQDLDRDGVIDAHGGDIPSPLFHAVDQPITGRPDVMIMNSACAARVPGYLVVFGTGRYLGAPDRTDRHRQSIYGIWDFGDDGDDSEHLGSVVDRHSGLLSSGYYLLPRIIEEKAFYTKHSLGERDTRQVDYVAVVDEGDADGVSVNNHGGPQRGDPAKFAGWFHDLALPPHDAGGAAERVTGDALLRGGKAIVASYLPNDVPCGSGGESRIYILSGCHGSITRDDAGEALMPIAIQGKVSDRAVVVKDPARSRLDKMLTCDQQGRLQAIDMPGERWGKISWRHGSAD